MSRVESTGPRTERQKTKHANTLEDIASFLRPCNILHPVRLLTRRKKTSFRVRFIAFVAVEAGRVRHLAARHLRNVRQRMVPAPDPIGTVPVVGGGAAMMRRPVLEAVRWHQHRRRVLRVEQPAGQYAHLGRLQLHRRNAQMGGGAGMWRLLLLLVLLLLLLLQQRIGRSALSAPLQIVVDLVGERLQLDLFRPLLLVQRLGVGGVCVPTTATATTVQVHHHLLRARYRPFAILGRHILQLIARRTVAAQRVQIVVLQHKEPVALE